MIEHVFVHQKTMTDKYEISFEIKNVLLPESCFEQCISIFWCIVYRLLDSVYHFDNFVYDLRAVFAVCVQF